MCYQTTGMFPHGKSWTPGGFKLHQFISGSTREEEVKVSLVLLPSAFKPASKAHYQDFEMCPTDSLRGSFVSENPEWLRPLILKLRRQTDKSLGREIDHHPALLSIHHSKGNGNELPWSRRRSSRTAAVRRYTGRSVAEASPILNHFGSYSFRIFFLSHVY